MQGLWLISAYFILNKNLNLHISKNSATRIYLPQKPKTILVSISLNSPPPRLFPLLLALSPLKFLSFPQRTHPLSACIFSHAIPATWNALSTPTI